MKQVRLKVKVLSEVDMATHFINWDKWLHEELEQKAATNGNQSECMIWMIGMTAS